MFFLLVVLDLIGDFVVGCEIVLVDLVVGVLVAFFFFEAMAVNNKIIQFRNCKCQRKA